MQTSMSALGLLYLYIYSTAQNHFMFAWLPVQLKNAMRQGAGLIQALFLQEWKPGETTTAADWLK